MCLTRVSFTWFCTQLGKRMLLIEPFHNSTSNFHWFSSVLHILMLFMPFFIYFCFSEIHYNFFKEIKDETEIVIWSAVSVQSVSSVTQSCPTLCNPMNRSTPGLPVHHKLLEFTQTHVHWVSDGIQPSHPLSTPSPAPNHSQHQGLSQWVISSHEVATVLEFQLQHQSFQWTPRTDLL